MLEAIEERLGRIERQEGVLGNRLASISTLVVARFGDFDRILRDLNKKVGKTR